MGGGEKICNNVNPGVEHTHTHKGKRIRLPDDVDSVERQVKAREGDERLLCLAWL